MNKVSPANRKNNLLESLQEELEETEAELDELHDRVKRLVTHIKAELARSHDD